MCNNHHRKYNFENMKIMVLGSGAREHAICMAFANSSHKPEIVNFGAHINPGINEMATKVEVGDAMDTEAVRNFTAREKPDMVFLGPDDPIGAGMANVIRELGIPCIGPTKSLARLESSKSFTRELIKKYDIPGNPLYKTFFDEEGMEEFAEQCGEIVVKYDGLKGGKGVHVQGDHFATIQDGLKYASECLKEAGKVVIEEKLVGQEFSLMFFVDGKSLIPMPIVQDNKRAFAGDTGPNTGGMGTVSDADQSLPFLTEADIATAKEITMKTIGALQAQCDEVYKGIVFGGFMATAKGVRLIEYNARFGDPESLNVLPLLATDFYDICDAMWHGTLHALEVEFLEQATVCKYIVPEGYPENPAKNVPVELDISKIPENVTPFFGSIELKNNQLSLLGSRAIAFTAVADTMAEAQYLAEEATKSISGPVFHREDIGTGELIRQRTEMMKALR
jgi:phosphoribosylamine--glycine ligase